MKTSQDVNVKVQVRVKKIPSFFTFQITFLTFFFIFVGRTVLLSTHYMDEADLLGDRIRIIANGRLQCSGTPLFLKRKFGKGYFLSVTKDVDNTAAQFDAVEIQKFVSSYIPGAKMYENFGTEVTYVLPSSARLTGEFSNLFQNLESSLESLGIKDYGISDTTLEEV